MSLGDERDQAWRARHGVSASGLPIDPQTGLAERRPGQVYMAPHNQWGAPEGWMDAQEFERRYNVGWTPKQMLVAAAPFIAGGIGALAGGGGAAAGGVPSIGVTGGIPAGATFGAPAATAGGVGAAGTTGAAAAAAKGAGMTFGLKDAVQFAPMIASLFSGRGHDEPPQNAAMNELIAMQTQRMRQADPLYQAILRMAMGLAPSQYRSAMPTASPTPAARAVPRAR